MDLVIVKTLSIRDITPVGWYLKKGKLTGFVSHNGGIIGFNEKMEYPEREVFMIYKEWSVEYTDQSTEYVILDSACYATGKIVHPECIWRGQDEHNLEYSIPNADLLMVLGPIDGGSRAGWI